MSNRSKTSPSAIRKSEAWMGAEFQYESMYAMSMFPMMGELVGRGDKVEQLKSMLQHCPNFYPAILEMGLLRLAKGDGKSAEQQVLKGIDLMQELAEPKHLEEEISTTIDNLEKFWSYDLCRQILEPMVKRRPNNAEFRDSLSSALAQLGELEAALPQIDKAVELAPDNPFFLTNRGWILLMAGRLEDAEKSLRRALHVRPGHPGAKGNLKVHSYLVKHGGTYTDYLVRPANRKRIDQLANDERREKADELSEEINSARQEAFALSLLRKGGRSRANIQDWLSTLTSFFGFVRDLANGLLPLDEDIGYVENHLESILHKFIFKFGDTDAELLESIAEATCAYYEFLATHKIVSAEDFRGYRTEIRKVMPAMIEKATRYKAVRHDSEVDEDEKENVREQLFGRDHLWPHL